MPKYIKYTGILLLAIIISCIGIEAFTRSIPNVYRFKDEWILQKGNGLRVLILGNSHNYYGIKPSVLGGNSFNASCVSQGIEEDYYLLKRYSAICPHLKEIIINVDFSNLFDPPLDSVEPHRLVYYHLYMGMPLRRSQWKYHFELSSPAALREKVSGYIMGTSQNCDSLGWGTGFRAAGKMPSALSAQSIANRTEGLKCKEFSYYKHNTLLLCEIAEFCQKRNLKLIIISTPVYPPYYSKTAKSDKVLLYKAIAKLSRYKCVRYVNCFIDNPLSQDDFFDCDHLSDIGAAKFSSQLTGI